MSTAARQKTSGVGVFMGFESLRDDAHRLINKVLSASSQSELDLIGLLKLCLEMAEANAIAAKRAAAAAAKVEREAERECGRFFECTSDPQ